MRSRPKLFLSLPSLGMSLVSAPPCLPPTETNRLFCALKASVWQVLAKCCHFLGCQWPLFWLLLCPQLWWAGFLHLPVLTMPSSDISQLPVAAVGLGFAGAMEGDHGCTTSALPEVLTGLCWRRCCLAPGAVHGPVTLTKLRTNPVRVQLLEHHYC